MLDPYTDLSHRYKFILREIRMILTGSADLKTLYFRIIDNSVSLRSFICQRTGWNTNRLV